MQNTRVRSETARKVDMKLEVVVIPVSDVDRAKSFYGDLGWRLDADFVVGDDFRVVQFTPPGSPCSIHFGRGVTSAAPGSAPGLYLVVSDIEAARAELIGRGVEVSEVFHRAGPGRPPVSGPDPAAAQLLVVRHVQRSGRQRLAVAGDHRATARARGRGRHDSSPRRRSSRSHFAVRRPRMASTRSGPAASATQNWPDWYAEYMVSEQAGEAAAAVNGGGHQEGLGPSCKVFNRLVERRRSPSIPFLQRW